MKPASPQRGCAPPAAVWRMRLTGLLVAAACGIATPAAAIDLIANPSVPLPALSRPMARAVFSMRMLNWPDGQPVRVYVLAEDNPVHQSMVKEVLDIYPYQLREAWNRLIYTGVGQAPILVASEQEMKKRVAATPGAIGYVLKANENDPFRTLTVR